MTAIRFGVVLLAAFAVACAASSGSANANRASGSDLALSLQVHPEGDSVHLVLQVTNAGTTPVPLEFSSGQEFDFAVLRGTEELWRWSSEMRFTQALRTQTLAAGATRTYRAAWRPAAATRGEFTAVGLLAARNRQVEQRAIFRLP